MDPLFWKLHSGLAHEAPGSRADTLRALALTGLSGPLRVLDAGSGPGAASLTLLEALPEAEVTALDLHEPFLADARARAEAAGLGARLRTCAGDMEAPPFAPGSFDLIWSEGAAYAIGVPQALAAWKPLLAPGGRIAFTDAVWTVADPHPRVRALFADYAEMTDIDGVRGRIAAAGLRLIADFLISEAAWAAYYDPLAARLESLADRHGPSHPILVQTAVEIALRREHPADYGYAFFVVA